MDSLVAAGRAVKYGKVSELAELPGVFRGFLPDNLVDRSVTITKDTQHSQFLADSPDRMLYVLEDRSISTGRAHYEGVVLNPISLADLARFRGNGLIGLEVSGELKPPPSGDPAPLAYSTDTGSISGIADAERRVIGAVKEASERRASGLLSEHFKMYPRGSALVIEDSDPYLDWVDSPFSEAASMARRVLAAGEFGHRVSIFIYGYSESVTGLKNLVEIYGENPRVSASLVTRDDISETVEALYSDDSVRSVRVEELG